MVLSPAISSEQLSFNIPVSFQFRFDTDLIAVTKQKLSLARFPEEQSDFDEKNWSQGAKVSRVKQLAEYWQHQFDWEQQEVRI